MFKFPFYGYPYNYNYYRYHNQFPNINMQNQKNKTVKNEDNTEKIEQEKEKSSITNSRKISNTTDQAIFEIFGIKLYLDDLIIIGVMYFLYQQNVHDEMLYLILFMLLFS